MLAHPPAKPVARHGAGHPTTSRESQPRMPDVVAAHVEDRELAVQTPPPAVDPPVVATRPYPLGPLLEAGGASGVPRSVQRQTDSRLRPLRRRRDRIARPCRVLIRRRKPCFFFRRRLFGWYVLFTFLPSLGRVALGRMAERVGFEPTDRVNGPWEPVRPPGGPSGMAERVGFEPTDRVNDQRFSRPPHSTTLAPLPVRWPPGASRPPPPCSWRRGWDSNPR